MHQNRLLGNLIDEAQNPLQMGAPWALDVGTCVRRVFKGRAMDPFRAVQCRLSVRRVTDADDVPIRGLVPEDTQTLGLTAHQKIALQVLKKHLRSISPRLSISPREYRASANTAFGEELPAAQELHEV